MALDDFQTIITRLVRDDSSTIGIDEIDQAVALSVARYSGDRPRELVVDVAGNGTALLDLPAGWIAGVSRALSIEYPIGAAPPTFINSEDWRAYRAPSGWKLQIDGGIAAAQWVRVTFTVPHTVDAATDT